MSARGVREAPRRRGEERRGERRRHRMGHRARGTLAPLVSHILRLQSRGALIWGLVLGLYAAALVASFLSFGDPQQMEQIMQAYPKGMMEAFGLSDMSVIQGYLAGQVFNLAPLALAFFPILTLSGAIAGAEERGTLDVLLGNPLPRWQLVVGSFVATALSLFGIVAVMGAVMWVTAVLVEVDLPLAASVEAVLNLWPTCVFFGALALLCSALFHRRSLATAVPAVVLFVMYLMDALGRVSEDLEGLRPASVFYHYGSAIEHGIEWSSFAGVTAVTLLLVALAAFAFSRRDIYA